ncbi:hypothetical protein, partial [Heyndrickxia ginsengihumi]|uniref:hypothetical protein n=1 Tax=Heyndrickxia ginsengihumi TaxID=363870 RepID=UPI00203C6860
RPCYTNLKPLACLSRAAAGPSHPTNGKRQQPLGSFHRTFDTTHSDHIITILNKIRKFMFNFYVLNFRRQKINL